MKTLRKLLLIFLFGGVFAACAGARSEVSTRKYVLTSVLEKGNLVFLGVGGDINGNINPTLQANPGETITVMLVNSGEGEHDIFFPELKVRSKRVTKNGESVSVTFRVPSEEVDLEYYDSVANHAEIGMVGILQVARAGGSQAAGEKVGMSVNNIVAQAFQKGGCGACHTIPGIAAAKENVLKYVLEHT